MSTASIHISNYQLLKILCDKIGEEQAEALVTYVESKVEEEFETHKDVLATKKDIYELSEKMNSHFRWLIGLFITQMAFVLGVVYFILNFSR